MKFRKNLTGSAAYKSAVLDSLFDVRFELDEALLHLIGETEEALRRWDGNVEVMSDEERDHLLGSEAEASWMLADGQTANLFSPFEMPAIHSEADEVDIANLKCAMKWAASAMDELPVSRRLLTDAHYLMCQGARYEKKYPGEFRTSPVWIGTNGVKLQDKGVYVPPVDDDMIAAFTDLERFIHYDNDVHPLVRVALAHYQFEAIHPFIDANGRIGRLLAQLMLIDYGYLYHPSLQLSSQLSRHSIAYYYLIGQTHITANYLEWVRWFIVQIKNATHPRVRLMTETI